MTQADPVRQRRVLVVDDCRDSTASLAFLLSYWGHDVRTAHEGRAALDLACLFRPDIVLLDIGMPGMSGFELARRLRRDAQLREALLVTVSGFGREEDRRQSLAAGCACHLVKPVEPEVLRHLVEAGVRERVQPSFPLDSLNKSHE